MKKEIIMKEILATTGGKKNKCVFKLIVFPEEAGEGRRGITISADSPGHLRVATRWGLQKGHIRDKLGQCRPPSPSPAAP